MKLLLCSKSKDFQFYSCFWREQCIFLLVHSFYCSSGNWLLHRYVLPFFGFFWMEKADFFEAHWLQSFRMQIKLIVGNKCREKEKEPEKPDKKNKTTSTSARLPFVLDLSFLLWPLSGPTFEEEYTVLIYLLFLSGKQMHYPPNTDKRFGITNLASAVTGCEKSIPSL